MNTKRYSSEEKEWIRNHSHFATTIKYMCDEFNKEFNQDVKPGDYARLYSRVTGKDSRTIRVYPEEVINYIKNECDGLLNTETTESVNAKFNTTYSVDQIRRCRKRFKIPNGVDCKFQKNFVPYNKGKRVIQHPNQVKTRFKKGQLSINKKPVGTISIRKNKSQNQVKYIKVADPNKWMLLNRYIWEQTTGDKLSNDEVVAFKDGNTMNCDFDNLFKINRKQNAIINNLNLRVDDPAYYETTLAVADLILSKSKKKGNKDV